MPPEGFALDALAQRNAALKVRLAQARRALERAKAQQKVVVSQRQEDRRDIAQQPVHKRKQPAREKTPADGDRRRQLANAQKQLQYYVKEQAALSRKLARVLALGHLDTLEATVAAKRRCSPTLALRAASSHARTRNRRALWNTDVATIRRVCSRR